MSNYADFPQVVQDILMWLALQDECGDGFRAETDWVDEARGDPNHHGHFCAEYRYIAAAKRICWPNLCDRNPAP